MSSWYTEEEKAREQESQRESKRRKEKMKPTYREFRSKIKDEMEEVDLETNETRLAYGTNVRLNMILHVLCQIRDALYLEDDE